MSLKLGWIGGSAGTNSLVGWVDSPVTVLACTGVTGVRHPLSLRGTQIHGLLMDRLTAIAQPVYSLASSVLRDHPSASSIMGTFSVFWTFFGHEIRGRSWKWPADRSLSLEGWTILGPASSSRRRGPRCDWVEPTAAWVPGITPLQLGFFGVSCVRSIWVRSSRTPSFLYWITFWSVESARSSIGDLHSRRGTRSDTPVVES